MTIDFRLGLIGHPLGHSLSPKIHAAALAACGLSGSYTLFPIPPDDISGLQALLARLRAGEMHGLNVTIPHKQNVLSLLDELTETAKAIGAVNTVSARNGRLIGDNTDAPGFLADLTRFLEISKIKHRKSAIILGAGGSARAVVYALCRAGWRVIIAARRIEQAQQLATSFTQHTIRATDFSHLPSFILPDSSFILVNTTPLGMTPAIETCPWPENIPLPAGAAVYDLVYNPRETRLVREARAAGLPAITGLGMLIEQAALAFEIWTGCQPPRAALWQAAEH